MSEFGFDDWMDAELRNVAVPHDLHERLAASAPRLPNDAELDSALRDVSVPPLLTRRLRRIPGQLQRQVLVRRFSLAASVLIVVGLGAYYGLRPADDPSAQIAQNPAQQSPTESTAGTPAARPKTSRPSAPAPREFVRNRATSPATRQQPETVPLGTGPRGAETNETLVQSQPAGLPFDMQTVTSMSTTIKQAIETRLRNQAALGASGQFEPLPELEGFESPLPRGIVPPRVRGYDMLFQLKYGEHPFVSPQANPELRTSRVPFAVGTVSYDVAAESIARGQLPPAEDVRVEDFLAAQRYALPTAPRGSVALHLAGAKSPLGDDGLHLLQVAAHGGNKNRQARKPTRLIVLVDTSAAMQSASRLKSIREGLLALQAEMTPADTLTLITFAENPQVLAEAARREDLEKLAAAPELAHGRGAANFSAAVQAAGDAVRTLSAKPAAETRRVVFLTTGRTEFDSIKLKETALALAELNVAGATWHVARLSSIGDEQSWNLLAKAGKGTTGDARWSEAVRGLFLEQLTGQPAHVASAVSLKITFNPQVVTSYRLLGHESATLTGDAKGPLEIDLLPNQTVTGLFELWLKPTGGEDVARVELTWRDPVTGQTRQAAQPVRRAQLAATFADAAPWLQQGILAAKTAEMLRGSYYIPNTRRLEQLLDLAGQAAPPAAQSPEFQALVDLIRQGSKLR